MHKAIFKMQDNIKREGEVLDDLEFQISQDIKK